MTDLTEMERLAQAMGDHVRNRCPEPIEFVHARNGAWARMLDGESAINDLITALREERAEVERQRCLAFNRLRRIERRDATITELEADVSRLQERVEAVEGALRAVPLTITSCHGHGGWYVCPAEHCHGRSDDPLKMEHKSGCYVPKLRAALQQKEPEA